MEEGKIVNLKSVETYLDGHVNALAFERGRLFHFAVDPRRLIQRLLRSADDLVHIVEPEINNGPDKKATVMEAINELFDIFVQPALPVCLKPFSGPIKKLIVNVFLSKVVDFIVGKYNEGTWKTA